MPPATPTIRSLAAELKVAPVTVSRALQGLASVRPELAKRIQQHAHERGYHADPVLAEVLGGLRRRTGVRYRETIAFVWTHALSNPLAEERGAKAAAEALGYRVDVIKPWTLGGGKADISRILWSRGIRGVLLASNYSRPDPRYDLDWTRFCTVLLGSSLVNTGLTRVSRNFYHDTTLALDRLRQHGCRRVGLVLESNFHERCGRRCVAALLVHGGENEHAHIVKVRNDTHRKAVMRWCKQTKPDGIVVTDIQIAGWLSGGPMMALLNQPGETVQTGVQVDFEQIGAEGMHALDALLRTDRRGLLPNPTSILVPGRWIENGILSES